MTNMLINMKFKTFYNLLVRSSDCGGVISEKPTAYSTAQK